ncbi:MAG: flagellar basal body rod protein FlgB [bacterium]
MKFHPLGKMTTLNLLKTSLGAYSQRNQAIAENIANVETKSYRPYKIKFEEELREAMQKGKPVGLKSDPRHMDIGGKVDSAKPKITTVNHPVNIENEMAELAKNQIRFEFAARKMQGTYQFLSSAIRGRMS